MRIYLSFFRIRFINSLQYRAVTIGSIITRFAWGLMEILALRAFYRVNPAAFPMEFSQAVSYIWLQQILIILFVVVFSDGEVYSAIEDGSIAYELVRPLSLYGKWFCQSAASRVAFTAINCAPALIIAFFIPAPYGLLLPQNAGILIMFLISAVLALAVAVSFAMLMYVSLFYTLSHRGVKIIVTALTSFLSGGIIPLPFFPAPVLKIAELLPFAAMQNMPLRIYSGNIAGAEALKGIAFQMFWLAALIILGQMAMSRALKRVIVQGG